MPPWNWKNLTKHLPQALSVLFGEGAAILNPKWPRFLPIHSELQTVTLALWTPLMSILLVSGTTVYIVSLKQLSASRRRWRIVLVQLLSIAGAFGCARAFYALDRLSKDASVSPDFIYWQLMPLTYAAAFGMLAAFLSGSLLLLKDLWSERGGLA